MNVCAVNQPREHCTNILFTMWLFFETIIKIQKMWKILKTTSYVKLYVDPF